MDCRTSGDLVLRLLRLGGEGTGTRLVLNVQQRREVEHQAQPGRDLGPHLRRQRGHSSTQGALVEGRDLGHVCHRVLGQPGDLLRESDVGLNGPAGFRVGLPAKKPRRHNLRPQPDAQCPAQPRTEAGEAGKCAGFTRLDISDRRPELAAGARRPHAEQERSAFDGAGSHLASASDRSYPSCARRSAESAWTSRKGTSARSVRAPRP